MTIHYALTNMTICGNSIVGRLDGTIDIHTTDKEEVNCEHCLKAIEDKKGLERYEKNYTYE